MSLSLGHFSFRQSSLDWPHSFQDSKPSINLSTSIFPLTRLPLAQLLLPSYKVTLVFHSDSRQRWSRLPLSRSNGKLSFLLVWTLDSHSPWLTQQTAMEPFRFALERWIPHLAYMGPDQRLLTLSLLVTLSSPDTTMGPKQNACGVKSSTPGSLSVIIFTTWQIPSQKSPESAYSYRSRRHF